MSVPARTKIVRFDDYDIWAEFADGRTLGIPPAWYLRLWHGSPELHEKVEISAEGSPLGRYGRKYLNRWLAGRSRGYGAHAETGIATYKNATRGNWCDAWDVFGNRKGTKAANDRVPHTFSTFAPTVASLCQ